MGLICYCYLAYSQLFLSLLFYFTSCCLTVVCFVITSRIILIFVIIHLISVIISDTFWCHRKSVTIFQQIIHKSITISRSFAFSMNVLLIFVMHDLNGALFLKISFSFLLLALSVPVTAITPFTTIYTSL